MDYPRAMRRYGERTGGTLIVWSDRRVFVRAPWGGPFVQMSREAAARALRDCRKDQGRPYPQRMLLR